MQRLILFRHAKAERARPGEEDLGRRLTEQGRSDAAIMGRVLAGEGLVPDLTLVSPSIRTQETWKALAFNGADARTAPRLYHAGAGELQAAAETAADSAQTLMIIAHNPGLHELVLRLLRAGSAAPSVWSKLQQGFPTSTAAVFQFDAAGRPVYDGVYYVRDHGGGGLE